MEKKKKRKLTRQTILYLVDHVSHCQYRNKTEKADMIRIIHRHCIPKSNIGIAFCSYVRALPEQNQSRWLLPPNENLTSYPAVDSDSLQYALQVIGFFFFVGTLFFPLEFAFFPAVYSFSME